MAGFSGDDLVTEGGPLWIKLRGENEGKYFARIDGASLETAGPYRATVLLEGRYKTEAGEADRWVLRVHAYAGCDFLTVQHSFLSTVDVRSTETMAVCLELSLLESVGDRIEVGVDGSSASTAASNTLSAVQVNAEKPMTTGSGLPTRS